MSLIAEDAYSFDRYGSLNWARCIRALRSRALADRDIEIVLRSKWTRWAADHGNKRYGRATAKDLIALMRQLGPEALAGLLAEGRGEA
jgi:hypothetical protein